MCVNYRLFCKLLLVGAFQAQNRLLFVLILHVVIYQCKPQLVLQGLSNFYLSAYEFSIRDEQMKVWISFILVT